MTIVRPLRRVAFAVLVVCLMLASLPVAGAVTRASAQGAAAPAQEKTAVEVVEQVSPAVVTVFNLATAPGIFGGGEAQAQGAGTGFIIDKEGHIVTNWHVVTGGDAYSVLLKDGTQVDAELVGTDPRDDIAVVKIDPAKVPATVSFGDSDTLKPGQDVLAIGSPLGAFTNTVTEGIVSALGRNQLESPSSNFCQNYTNLIQHDAAINQGNSGGPLFNMQGQVVGVNTLGIPTSQQGVPVQGIFFAVPANTVKVVVQQLIETGTVEAPYFGISSVPIDPTTASAYNLPVDYGVYVADIEQGGPAAGAGLQPDDIITAIDGKKITFEQPLQNILLAYHPGDTVKLTVLRGDQETTVDLTLGQAPQELFEQCTLQGGGAP